MESIKPLPERVRSSVRSGFIISDMIRVVEELVYNSLDAGSTKVSVSVGVGRGYVKVEDNGCGISRDGLVLLGERYATSKHDIIPETSSGLRTFGNRGEVLCSIADVSMLEIITKAKGRPNGYRKIMKGSNCLHLVVVHDIFYNQPVRRTHMQTSPKKVLHSIKKSVLQIALVRPQVVFSIVDIESEGELLRTHSSSSPLALLISHYGIKVAHLHELSLSEGSFELAGYISSSPENFIIKGIQHIYVNSRFIDKSPIHKSLNGLASTFWEQLNSNQGGKRSRPQACATYCLNLTCPQSLYELNIEQSKTSVEFKDWLSVLSFIEKSVASLWSNTTSNGQLLSSTAEPTSKHHMRKDADIIVSTNIGNREAKKEKIIQHSSSQCNQYAETSPIKGLPLRIGPKMKESLYSPDVANARNKMLGSTVHAYGHSKINNAKFIQQSSSQHDLFPETSPIEGFRLRTGRKMKEAVNNMPDVTKTQNEVKLDNPLQGYDMTDLGVKWRDGCPQAGSEYRQNYQMNKGKSNCQDRYTILNVSSGILHLASDTIVPKSINRNCLEASKILMQVDKKFIPVVAGKVLAVIDQHAADERIRLEDLRHKVLSGKMKTVAYLEEEKEMMLPETVYQLLHNYTDQIKHWGWICNIFQDSQSFSKNLNVLNKQPGTVRLLAVPCILGVNLSDDDLLEYIQQLAETDGSSTVPPSVLRILNYKACRGAIMFGDTLLPSECSLIVEELKRTSLCFQCAHGRPTMAPLVNLEALHKQIKKLGSCKDESSQAWHGLQRQPISLERAKQRLGTSA